MKLLLAFDGSEPAENALDDLALAGLPADAQAIILTVIPFILPPEAPEPQSYEVQGFPDCYAEVVVRNRMKSVSSLKAKESAASRHLKRLFPGWKIGVECVNGSPSHEIHKRAGTYEPDLIVLGSRGWSLTGKLLIGSVAEKALLHSRWNTRIGNGKPRKPGPPRLIIGFDGSKESRLAVEVVAERDWPKGTFIQLTTVSDFQNRIDQMTRTLGARRIAIQESIADWPWMENKMAKAKDRLDQPGIEVGTTVLSGDPRTKLIDQAKKIRADTVFLGSHGLTGVRQFLLGSVSSFVSSHPPCSIEIVRMRPGFK